MMCLFFGNVPGVMLVVGLGLSLVCSKVGLIKVWGLDLILGLAWIKFGLRFLGYQFMFR